MVFHASVALHISAYHLHIVRAFISTEFHYAVFGERGISAQAYTGSLKYTLSHFLYFLKKIQTFFL
jgi:hypothetical protein